MRAKRAKKFKHGGVNGLMGGGIKDFPHVGGQACMGGLMGGDPPFPPHLVTLLLITVNMEHPVASY